MSGPSQYSTTVPDMDEFNALAARVTDLEERVTALENVATEPLTPSADGTRTSEADVVLVDDALGQWRINDDRSIGHKPSGAAWGHSPNTANVSEILKQGTCYQCNDAGDWYVWQNDRWQRAAGDPTLPPDVGGEPGASYRVSNGKIIAPDGSTFVAEGVCVLDAVADTSITGPDCKPLLDHFPTTTFVHFVNFHWTDPLPFAKQIDWLTAKGIVVQIGSYTVYPAVPTGDLLRQECDWAAASARRYMHNPRVWYCCGNEPQDWYVGLPSGSISAEHKAMYDAIRNTGNQAPIGICATGCVLADGLDFNAYGHMRGVVWNVHYYNWLANGSPDYQANVNALYNEIADQQRIRSGDGVIPCLVGEYGNATDGAHVDAGGWAAVQAVLDVSPAYSGNAAFCYSCWPSWMGGSPNADQLTDEWNNWAHTEYGLQVHTDFAESPVPPPAQNDEPVPAAAEAALRERKWPIRELVRQRLEARPT